VLDIGENVIAAKQGEMLACKRAGPERGHEICGITIVEVGCQYIEYHPEDI